jgi:hypothetical protein
MAPAKPSRHAAAALAGCIDSGGNVHFKFIARYSTPDYLTG